MGSTATASSDLGLDLRPPAAMRKASGFLREVSRIGDGDGKEMVVKLEEYVWRLEEERRKIEGFKRELPLCMLVLKDVIEELELELEQCRRGESNTRSIPEELVPIKRKFEEERGIKLEKDYKDKMSWMSSAQLWSDNYSNNNNTSTNTNKKKITRERADDAGRRPDNENPFAEGRSRSGGGAFLPFKELSGFPTTGARKEKPAADAETAPLPGLSLLFPGTKSVVAVSAAPEEQRSGGSSSKGSSRAIISSAQQQSQNTTRKARRCWSPELHRRFIGALQQLGGSQAATPKQIRELMKVDGLTNDEVKSHLQKYRLHTRRTPSSSAPVNQPVVMLGGLWVPQDHCPVSKQSTSQSGSPQGPLQLASAARGISVTGGDSCEEEDGKSESYSWKGHVQRSSGEETD